LASLRTQRECGPYIKVPMNRVALLELVGLVFDTGMILEDKLEDGRWTSLDKIDRYFFQMDISIA